MVINDLQTKQPVIFKTISNALARDEIAHTFLFAGSKNRLKLETAFLLAASIIDASKQLVSEDNNTYKRIKSLDFTDFYFIDGEKESIKRDEIIALKENLSLTGLEGSGRKVYVINNINNSNPKVLNMLLKFMEEPTSSDIFAILITDSVQDLLETIVSRSFKLTFLEESRSDLFRSYEKMGMNQYDSYVLSTILKEPESLNQNAYVNAKYLKDNFLKYSETINDFEYYLHNIYFENLKDAKDKKDIFYSANYFIQILKLMINDVLGTRSVNQEYDQELKTLENSSYDLLALLELLVETEGKMETRYDIRLLLDELTYKIDKCRK